MIAAECEQRRSNKKMVDRVTNPIFNKVLIERDQKINHQLTEWFK